MGKRQEFHGSRRETRFKSHKLHGQKHRTPHEGVSCVFCLRTTKRYKTELRTPKSTPEQSFDKSDLFIVLKLN